MAATEAGRRSDSIGNSNILQKKKNARARLRQFTLVWRFSKHEGRAAPALLSSRISSAQRFSQSRLHSKYQVSLLSSSILTTSFRFVFLFAFSFYFCAVRKRPWRRPHLPGLFMASNQKCISHGGAETSSKDFSQVVSKCYRRRLLHGLPVVYNANKALNKKSLLASGNASHLITFPYLQQAVHSGYLPLARWSQETR